MHNFASLPKEMYYKITGYYNSIRPAVTGSTEMTVREWISTQSFEKQYEFGQEVIQNVIKQ